MGLPASASAEEGEGGCFPPSRVSHGVPVICFERFWALTLADRLYRTCTLVATEPCWTGWDWTVTVSSRGEGRRAPSPPGSEARRGENPNELERVPSWEGREGLYCQAARIPDYALRPYARTTVEFSCSTVLIGCITHQLPLV